MNSLHSGAGLEIMLVWTFVLNIIMGDLDLYLLTDFKEKLLLRTKTFPIVGSKVSTVYCIQHIHIKCRQSIDPKFFPSEHRSKQSN